ncbi:MAG: MFS transporter [Rickettsiaceae bacterium]|nr:MFS transporter [Rickettsiaceae bacterium]
MKQNSKIFLASIIGNVLDRYDIALYGFMVAFMAPNFFPSEDPLVSAIKAYGVMATSMITKPLGNLFFGRLAMTIGPKKVMVMVLSGVAITTGAIGFVPNYESIGSLATVIFVSLRIMQNFFASGENTIAPLFILQNAPTAKETRVSSLFGFSTMIGVVIASFISMIVSNTNNPLYYWRYAYFAGFCTAFIGIYLRFSLVTKEKEPIPTIGLYDIAKTLVANRHSSIRIIFVSSFSYITYTIPFIFMNVFVPEITNVSISEMLQLNSMLLLLDTSLLPLFGLIAENFEIKKFMASMSVFIWLIILPLFYFMPGSGFLYVIFARIVIILCGLAFLAPLQAWYYSLVSGNDKYLVIGISASIGEEVLGRNSTAICLLLWHYFKNPIAPAMYIFLIAGLASFALIFMDQTTKKQESSIKLLRPELQA